MPGFSVFHLKHQRIYIDIDIYIYIYTVYIYAAISIYIYTENVSLFSLVGKRYTVIDICYFSQRAWKCVPMGNKCGKVRYSCGQVEKGGDVCGQALIETGLVKLITGGCS